MVPGILGAMTVPFGTGKSLMCWQAVLLAERPAGRHIAQQVAWQICGAASERSYRQLWDSQRDSNVGSAEAEEKRQLAGLVAQQAAATLLALNTTAAALDEVEDAAAAVERAKGHADEQVGHWASSRTNCTMLAN